MQLLASFKNPAHGAQSHLKFSKIQGSSEPHVQKSFKLCQKLHLILLTMPVLKYKRLRLKLRVFLVGHSVAMITYCVTKIIPMCSPMIGQCLDTMIIIN